MLTLVGTTVVMFYGGIRCVSTFTASLQVERVPFNIKHHCQNGDTDALFWVQFTQHALQLIANNTSDSEEQTSYR
jgi:hypothetical protein